jgi:hypothetical protein
MNYLFPKRAPPSPTDIIIECAKFALGEDVISTWRAFMSDHAHHFLSPATDAADGADANEYKLEWSDVHRQYEELVESQIGEFLAERGSNMAVFSEYLASVDDDKEVDERAAQVNAFAELLVGTVDFRAFCDILKDEKKRDYYFQILGMWRRSLK